MTEDTHTIATGHIDVGDGHSIYYQAWGNSSGVPIFVLHGGPGGATSDSQKIIFDPKKHFVVFHDQRGCGMSTPLGELQHNTTDDLIDDINRLKTHLKITEPIHLYGTSWGSTLSLVYAIRNPKAVKKILLSGIYTATKAENDYLMQGGLATHFPDSWGQYVEPVPINERNDTVGFYARQFENPKRADDFIRRWYINEGTAAVFDADYLTTEIKNSEIKEESRILVKTEAFYFQNNCFLPDNYIFDSADKLKAIPIVMVQGRFDHVCPPITAYNLARKIGSSCRLHLVPGSHAREMAIRETLRAYAWSFMD